MEGFLVLDSRGHEWGITPHTREDAPYDTYSLEHVGTGFMTTFTVDVRDLAGAETLWADMCAVMDHYTASAVA